jgi:hypothetical protein
VWGDGPRAVVSDDQVLRLDMDRATTRVYSSDIAHLLRVHRERAAIFRAHAFRVVQPSPGSGYAKITESDYVLLV